MTVSSAACNTTTPRSIPGDDDTDIMTTGTQAEEELLTSVTYIHANIHTHTSSKIT